MPRRVVQRFLKQAMGLDISLGSTQKCWEEASEAGTVPCQALETKLASEAVLNVDETGWRQNGEKRCIRAFVENSFTYYLISANRRGDVLVEVLGAVISGILCRDRVETQPASGIGSGRVLAARTLGLGRVGAACEIVSTVVEISGRQNRPRPADRTFSTASQWVSSIGKTLVGQRVFECRQSGQRDWRTLRTPILLSRRGRSGADQQ